MLSDPIYLTIPTEMGNLSEMPQLDIKDKAAVFFTVHFNSIEQGKNQRALADGSTGHVKWLNVRGECHDLKTHEPLGQTSFKLFLNTKGSFLTSQFAVLVGTYDHASGRCALNPQVHKRKDGKEEYTIPAINGRRLIAGLVRTDDWIRSTGEAVPQYSLACMLSDTGFSAKHVISNTFDEVTRDRDWEWFTRQLERQYDYQLQRAENNRIKPLPEGVSSYGVQQPAANPYNTRQQAPFGQNPPAPPEAVPGTYKPLSAADVNGMPVNEINEDEIPF